MDVARGRRLSGPTRDRQFAERQVGCNSRCEANGLSSLSGGCSICASRTKGAGGATTASSETHIRSDAIGKSDRALRRAYLEVYLLNSIPKDIELIMAYTEIFEDEIVEKEVGFPESVSLYAAYLQVVVDSMVVAGVSTQTFAADLIVDSVPTPMRAVYSTSPAAVVLQPSALVIDVEAPVMVAVSALVPAVQEEGTEVGQAESAVSLKTLRNTTTKINALVIGLCFIFIKLVNESL